MFDDFKDFKEFMIRNFGKYLDYKPKKNYIELKKNCLPLKFSQQLINQPLIIFQEYTKIFRKYQS